MIEYEDLYKRYVLTPRRNAVIYFAASLLVAVAPTLGALGVITWPDDPLAKAVPSLLTLASGCQFVLGVLNLMQAKVSEDILNDK